jgi:hypothetical protein
VNKALESKQRLIDSLKEAKLFLIAHKISEWPEAIEKTINYFMNDDFSRIRNVFIVWAS